MAKILADAGYGSENNYRFLEGKMEEHTALIPYGTMMKAYLRFKRYHVRGNEKFRRETEILIITMNMVKLTIQRRIRYID